MTKKEQKDSRPKEVLQSRKRYRISAFMVVFGLCCIILILNASYRTGNISVTTVSLSSMTLTIGFGLGLVLGLIYLRYYMADTNYSLETLKKEKK